MTTPPIAQRWIPDNSALQAFRENPEAFRLKYRHHLVPATPNDKMTAGSAIHAGRNVLYAWRVDAPLGAAYPDDIVAEAVRVGRAHRGEGEGARGAEQVEMVLRTYAAKYASEPFSVVESERYAQTRVPCAAHINVPALKIEPGDASGAFPTNALFFCPDCFDFCGIIDAVIRFPDGSEYVADLKSTGAYLNENWETTARLGDQFVGYVAMRRALGHRCDGFFVDGIHMRDAKPRKDGSVGVPSVDEDDFVRVGPVSVPEWRVERWAADVRYTLRAIRELEASRGLDTPWPIYQNWPYGKVDAYREFYETPAELHSQVRNMYEVRQWSPQQVAEERAVAPTQAGAV